MKVRSRLLLGFGGVVLLLLAPTLFAASRLAELRHLAVEGRSGQAEAVANLGRMQALASDLDRLERSLVATSDSGLGAEALSAVDSLVVRGLRRAGRWGRWCAPPRWPVMSRRTVSATPPRPSGR